MNVYKCHNPIQVKIFQTQSLTLKKLSLLQCKSRHIKNGETIIYVPCTMTEKLKTELQELTEFYKTANIPDQPIKINRYLTLLKPREFPAREIEKLKEFQGSDIVHKSLFNHLRELKQTLVDQSAISNL